MKASKALMTDRSEDGAALLRWLKQKQISDAQEPTPRHGTSISAIQIAPTPAPEVPLPSI